MSQLGVGEPNPGEPFRPIRESVVFTCMTDRDAHSRSNEIVGGSLNRLNHSDVCRLVEGAGELGHRFEAHPHNVPDEQDVRPPIVIDSDGLRWATKRRQTVVVNAEPEVRPCLELVCLYDSALRKEIVFPDDEAIERFLTADAEERLRSLIQLLKQTSDLPSRAVD